MPGASRVSTCCASSTSRPPRRSPTASRRRTPSGPTTEVNLPFLCAGPDGQPRHLITQLERKQLEQLVEPLVQNSLGPCRRALQDAGLTAKDIDVVILVGGQTRMPRIHAVVAE